MSSYLFLALSQSLIPDTEYSLHRCLLNKKAAPVMKIIHDIFNLILKFHSQLISQSWAVDSDSGQVAHPAFEHLRNSYKAFNECSVFLYKGLSSFKKL